MLVDDHAVLRDGLKSILSLAEDIQVVGEAVSGEDALTQLNRCLPDVVVMDIQLPNMDGIEITKQVKQQQPEIKILVLSMFNQEEYFLRALRAGADGYLLKDTPSEQVVQAIRTIAKGDSVIHSSLTKKLLAFNHNKNTSNEYELTEREKEVLTCLVEGLSNKEIAEKLFISDKTVKIHVSKIFKKLGVKSRSQVIIYAVQNQLVPFTNQSF